MAKIYPDRLPQSILEDPKRTGERSVYNALKGLPNDYTVYYSLHWLSDPSRKGIFEGEADFVVTHPQMGIMFIEVKGGGVQYDAETNKWYSVARTDEKFEIRDPLVQASSSRYHFASQLKAIGQNPKIVNIGHTVCFPEIFVAPDVRLKADLPREIILDRTDVENIETSIMRVFQSFFGENLHAKAPGPEFLQIVDQMFASSFEMMTPLGVELEHQDEKLIHLTEQQFMALSLLGNRQRAAIGGCAGSGKTMLAVRKAQQFANMGLRVLLTCFNAPLAEHLSARVHNVEVRHFHGLCTHVAQQKGYRLRTRPTEDAYFTVELPQALIRASSTSSNKYDAIIVDEGQDFIDTYWHALESLLADDGYLYIFYDNNQNLYEGSMTFGGLMTEPPFTLSQNCRNTRLIHQAVVKFHSNPQELYCPGPDGQSPELFVYKSDNEEREILTKLLNRFVNEEQIDCDDIVVLTPRGNERSIFSPGTKLGNITLTANQTDKPDHVQVSTVHRFKGLERRVVILTEVDEKSPHKLDIVLYVGCSRARTHLVVLYNATTPPEIIERLTKTTR